MKKYICSFQHFRRRKARLKCLLIREICSMYFVIITLGCRNDILNCILLWNVPHNSHTMPILGTYYSHFMPKVCPKCGTYIPCDQIMPKVWHIVCDIVCPRYVTLCAQSVAHIGASRRRATSTDSAPGLCGQRVFCLLTVRKSAVIVDNQVSDFQCRRFFLG